MPPPSTPQVKEELAVQAWDPLNGKQYTMRYTSAVHPTEREIMGMSEPDLRLLERAVGLSPESTREAVASAVAAVRSQVVPSRGLKAYMDREPGCAKRFFLCKDYQKGKCRRMGECNSLHVDRQAVAAQRAQYPCLQTQQGRRTLRVRSEEDNETFDCPVERLASAGKGSVDGVWVRVMQRDADLEDLVTDTIDGSGTWVKVEAAHMRHMRTMWQLPCCSSNGCPDGRSSAHAGRSELAQLGVSSFVVGRSPGAGHDASLLWLTKGLSELSEQACGVEHAGQLRIPVNRICRPHIRKECKWGRSCMNVHVCRNSTLASGIAPRPKQEGDEAGAAEASSPKLSGAQGVVRAELAKIVTTQAPVPPQAVLATVPLAVAIPSAMPCLDPAPTPVNDAGGVFPLALPARVVSPCPSTDPRRASDAPSAGGRSDLASPQMGCKVAPCSSAVAAEMHPAAGIALFTPGSDTPMSDAATQPWTVVGHHTQLCLPMAVSAPMQPVMAKRANESGPAGVPGVTDLRVRTHDGIFSWEGGGPPSDSRRASEHTAGHSTTRSQLEPTPGEDESHRLFLLEKPFTAGGPVERC
eukprot:TRINITY_DN962_c1_g1_i2.p1 TRINITY_DN962_c1_g1~~TRINITY_DN962_c1_g1_i2.p1  ORF type:complete len:581 (+),score=75.10 TRINITY_DN962_c1_g1_i2:158-1900(+)